MKKLLSPLCLALLLGLPPAASAQSLPVVRARSSHITISDGDDLLQGAVVHGLRPDTYVYHPTGKTKTITYRTDSDSITATLHPGESFDFVVLFEGDSCFQRFSAVNPNAVAYNSPAQRRGRNDTIPMRLGANNAVYVQGQVNGSEPMDLEFDTGASLGVLTEKGRKKADLRPGNSNDFRIGSIELKGSPMIYVDYGGAVKAGAVIGWNAFEGRVVELDYDRGILVIHNDETLNTNGYEATDMVWRGSAMFIEAGLRLGNREVRGLVQFDNGSRWALSLTKTFCTEKGLYGLLKELGTHTGSGYNGRNFKVHSTTALLPELRIGSLSLQGVPVDLEDSSDEGMGLPQNLLGNDVLKRYNVILDYARGKVYLKENSLKRSAYNRRFPMGQVLTAGVLLLALLAGLIAWLLRTKRNRSRRNAR